MKTAAAKNRGRKLKHERKLKKSSVFKVSECSHIKNEVSNSETIIID